MDNIQEMVSVVIPYYNRQKCIIKCLESVLNQTYQNLEVIIVDDGSTESAEKILAPYLGERVRYHRYTPNQGACHARNVGASLARGGYVAFQDSDDIWLPNKLELELDYLHSGGWEMVFCGMNRHPAQGSTSYYPSMGFEEDQNAVEQLLACSRISTQTMLLTRETADRLTFDESFPKNQDWDYSINAALKGVKIGYLAMPLVDSEVQADSITATVKAGPAREKIYHKYYSEYLKYPKSHARALEDMARCFKSMDRKKSARYLRQSLRIQFTIKRLVKYHLTIAGVLK